MWRVPVLLGFLIWASAAAASPPTFNKDVLPILQKNCQVCHRPGEIGPMSFLTYESTRPWAKAIREAVLTKSMPPWFADPAIGRFANERKLNAAETKTIVEWIDAGAPEGEAKDKAVAMQWTDGWNIQPDVIYEMPAPYTIPKQGVLDYVYFPLPAKFAEDTWVIDGEIQPGNRSAVHHASVVVRPPGSAWMKDARPGEPYIPTTPIDTVAVGAAPPDAQFSWLFGYAPGATPQRYFSPDHDAGRLVPAGSDLFLEMHYTANGREAEDRTKVGLVLSKKPPVKRLLNLTIQARTFAIPPYAPHYAYSAAVALNEPVALVYLQPHLHMRGTDMTIKVTYPDGRSETLLSVPRYNYMWQVIYVLAKPIPLPKDTVIEISAHWDNSANNKFNPDPSKTVRWGQQSWDEMLVAILGTTVESATQRK
jgi:hypothetical protein